MLHQPHRPTRHHRRLSRRALLAHALHVQHRGQQRQQRRGLPRRQRRLQLTSHPLPHTAARAHRCQQRTAQRGTGARAMPAAVHGRRRHELRHRREQLQLQLQPGGLRHQPHVARGRRHPLQRRLEHARRARALTPLQQLHRLRGRLARLAELDAGLLATVGLASLASLASLAGLLTGGREGDGVVGGVHAAKDADNRGNDVGHQGQHGGPQRESELAASHTGVDGLPHGGQTGLGHLQEVLRVAAQEEEAEASGQRLCRHEGVAAKTSNCELQGLV